MQPYTLDDIRKVCEGASRAGLYTGSAFIDARLKAFQANFGHLPLYYSVLQALARIIKPEVSLEIGSWRGTSAACLAHGHPVGLVLTIDHHSDPGDDVNRELTLQACAAFPNLVYFQGSSTLAVQRLKPTTDCALPHIYQHLLSRQERIELFFIDGWHRGDLARADFDAYRELLAPGALVICDDLVPEDSDTISGMIPFWESLPGEKYLDHNIHPGFPMGFLKYEP